MTLSKLFYLTGIALITLLSQTALFAGDASLGAGQPLPSLDIEAGGEMAIIKGSQAKSFRKIYLDKDHKATTGFFQGSNPKLERFLKSRGYSGTNILGFNKTLRYTEGVIGLSEKIAVMGIAE